MIDIKFDGLEEAKKIYDPVLVEKAAFSATRKLQAKTATRVSLEVRKAYDIKAGEVSKALLKRVRTRGGVPVGYLIYTGKRISLRHFAGMRGSAPSSAARPRVNSARGARYGAKAKVMKSRPPHLVKGGFWGRGRIGKEDGAGEMQIFQRTGVTRGSPRFKGDEKLRKLTGPSIAHMIRNEGSIDAMSKLLQAEASETLSKELEFFIKRQAGIQ